LRKLTDTLCRDPKRFVRVFGFNISPVGSPPLTAVQILQLNKILDDARDLELESAPSLVEYLVNGVGNSVAIGGLAMSFTGPIIGVVAASVSLGIGLLGGATAFWSSTKLIHRDLILGDRLRAIQEAQTLLLVAANNLP